MRRRIYLTTIVLSLILCSGAFGDVAEQLREADRLASEGRIEQATQAFRTIATAQAATDAGLEAREKLTCLYVRTGKRSEAESEFEAMRSGYKRHRGLIRAETHVGDAYRETGNHTKACALYSNVISEWPSDEHAMWSQMGMTISRISQGNKTAAENAFQKLRADYVGQEHISRAICIVGDHYRKLGKQAKALELYDDVLENWPNADFALWARMGEAISKIRLGEEVDESIAKLVTDFEGALDLPSALCSIGDEYRKLGAHNAACELYGEIIENHPSSDHAFWAHQNTAMSRIWLRDDEGAQDAVEKVLAFSAGEDERIPLAARNIGDEYRKAEKYDEAFELYEYVVENHADTKEALWSQMNLANAKIRLGDPNADSAAEKLLTNYSTDTDIAAATCWVGDQYRRYNRHDEALKLYKRVLDRHPESDYAMWSHMGLAMSSLEMGDDPNAQDALAQLLASYGQQNGFGRAMEHIAGQYYRGKDLVKWREVYQIVLDVVETVPEVREGLWGKAAAAISNVHLGHEDDANGVLGSMVADFNDHPELPLALWRVANAYYYNGSRLQGAGREEEGNAQVKMMVTLGRRLREKLPATDDTVEAWFFAGIASDHCGEHMEAVEYFREVVKRWPSHKFAAPAQYQIGQTFKNLKVPEEISRSARRIAVKEAYDKVIEDYPDTWYADTARRWLNRMSIYFRGEQK